MKALAKFLFVLVLEVAVLAIGATVFKGALEFMNTHDDVVVVIAFIMSTLVAALMLWIAFAILKWYWNSITGVLGILLLVGSLTSCVVKTKEESQIRTVSSTSAQYVCTTPRGKVYSFYIPGKGYMYIYESDDYTGGGSITFY